MKYETLKLESKLFSSEIMATLATLGRAKISNTYHRPIALCICATETEARWGHSTCS